MTGRFFTFIGSLCIISLLFTSGCHSNVTLETLLEEMADRERLTLFPEEPFTHQQFSSYNRASVAPGEDGWFANVDLSHFIRVEENSGRREFVMFDADGPGAVVRWWMTFYKAQHGTIRIYLDGDSTPVIQGAPDQLLSGSLLTGYPLAVSLQKGAPVGEAGRDYDHNFYLPIPFEHHCKITYECDSLRVLYDYEGTTVPEGYWWPDVFYNIGYRKYTEDTEVETFSTGALKELEPVLKKSVHQLITKEITSDSKKTTKKLLTPGDSITLVFNQEGSAINQLAVKLDGVHKNQALRSTVMKMAFDGKQTVWVPVGEFFGTGYSLATHETWMNYRDETGRMESFWVMPFRKQCVITIINYGSEEVAVQTEAGLTSYKWEPQSMYFGASWHEYYHIATRDKKGAPYDLNMINIKGKGVYVGDQITLYNNTYLWWGEGDEKIFVDGEAFPSSFGTGTEDYYGYSFARQEPFSHPFLSQPVGIGNMSSGVTINMRHRSLDAIPFRESISANMELWHWADIRMNYAITSYYYIVPPFEINIPPDIESVQRPVTLTKSDFNKGQYYGAEDFEKVKKIDAHFHYLTEDTSYINFASALNFNILTPNWDGEYSIHRQMEIASSILQSCGDDFAFFGTFSVDSFEKEDFAERTIERVKECMEAGASGIKIWKNIGMVLQDSVGNYIMIDDPAFDPLFQYLEKKGIPVMAHLGEPLDCWLPVDDMTDPSNKYYYRNHPHYHMYLQPEVPSYAQQIAARDRVLERYPNLDFIGAHMGSIEWSVDELAKRLDAYPNMKFDLAARMYYLRYQSLTDREKVRDFLIRYQDRVIYGTDHEVHDIPAGDVPKKLEGLRNGWMSHWIYLATDSITDVQGLKLPKDVIDKIYYHNAIQYFR